MIRKILTKILCTVLSVLCLVPSFNVYADENIKYYSLDINSVNSNIKPYISALYVDGETNGVYINNKYVGAISGKKQSFSLVEGNYTVHVNIDLETSSANAYVDTIVDKQKTALFSIDIAEHKYYKCTYYPDKDSSSNAQTVQSTRNGDIHIFGPFSFKYGSKEETFTVQLVQSTGNVYVNGKFVKTLDMSTMPIVFEYIGEDFPLTPSTSNVNYMSGAFPKYTWPDAKTENRLFYDRSKDYFKSIAVTTEYTGTNEYLNLPSVRIQTGTEVEYHIRTDGTDVTGTGTWEDQGRSIEVVCEYYEDNECGNAIRNIDKFPRYWAIYGQDLPTLSKVDKVSKTLELDIIKYKNIKWPSSWTETYSYPGASDTLLTQYAKRTSTWSDWSSWANSPQTPQDRDIEYDTRYQYSNYVYDGNPSNVTEYTDACSLDWVQHNSKCGTDVKECETAACGVKTCQTASCGVASYNSCPNDKCDVLSYKTCTTSACGAKVCETAACGYKSCATSACGVSEYNTCQNSAFGYQTCDNPDCGANYKTCRNSACGVESTTYKSCANSACGVASYKTCVNSACGVASTTYKSCRNSACGIASTTYKSCAVSTCGCSVYNYVLGVKTTCKTYKSCRAAACGVESTTYNSCRTSACGVESYSYKSCATSACGVSSYKSCRTSACGVESYTYKSCATSGCGVASYKTCATAACGAKVGTGSACGVKSYNTCTTSACGTKTCQHADCGYMTCDNAACGANYASCPAPACGVKSYISCPSEDCGYKTCQNAACGTETRSCYLYNCPTNRTTQYRYRMKQWLDWEGWYNTTTSITTTTNTEIKYRYKNGILSLDDEKGTSTVIGEGTYWTGDVDDSKKGTKTVDVVRLGGTYDKFPNVGQLTYDQVEDFQIEWTKQKLAAVTYNNYKENSNVAITDTSGKMWLLWEDYESKLNEAVGRRGSLDDIQGQTIYAPYLYFWGYRFVTSNQTLPVGNLSKLVDYRQSVRIPSNDSGISSYMLVLIESTEPATRDTKVIYFDYNNPLSNYKDELPENWQGYEYLIDEIKQTNIKESIIRVEISRNDLFDMKQYLKEHAYDDSDCDMLREFAHIFKTQNGDLSDFLKGTSGCRIEEE